MPRSQTPILPLLWSNFDALYKCFKNQIRSVLYSILSNFSLLDPVPNIGGLLPMIYNYPALPILIASLVPLLLLILQWLVDHFYPLIALFISPLPAQLLSVVCLVCFISFCHWPVVFTCGLSLPNDSLTVGKSWGEAMDVRWMGSLPGELNTL